MLKTEINQCLSISYSQTIATQLQIVHDFQVLKKRTFNK